MVPPQDQFQRAAHPNAPDERSAIKQGIEEFKGSRQTSAAG